MTSDIKSNVLETANGLYEAGVMDRKTLREISQLCVPQPSPMDAEAIKRLRIQSKVSQPIFAAYLNTSVSTVQKWEQGQKRPGGAALRLLNLAERNGLESLVRD